MSSFEVNTPVSIQMQEELDMLFKRKSEALCSMESMENEEEIFSRHNSKSTAYTDHIRSELSDNEDEEEECEYILISSRSDNQFTLRLNQQIQKLTENKIFNQIKSNLC